MDILIKEYKLIKIINEILKSNVKEVVSIRKTDFNFVVNVIDQNNRHKTLAIAISDFEKWWEGNNKMRNIELLKQIKNKDIFIDNIIEFFSEIVREITFRFDYNNYIEYFDSYQKLNLLLEFLSTTIAEPNIRIHNTNSPYIDIWKKEKYND